MRQAKTLQQREIKTVLAVISTRRYAARDRAIFAISFFAGLRAQEIAALTFENVLGTDGTVGSEFLLLPSQTKGKHTRKIFVSDKLRKELELYVKSRPKPNQLQRPFFVTQKGNPFTANAICHLFKAIYLQGGLAGASSHSGRRTFITDLAAKGVSVRVLAALAGHLNISTTQRYIDINDRQLRAAVELV